ncbi:hypothetical protein [Paraburkholderia mimosarum]|uniref:hypothetical protein n=1 Tax=Paraburkholderia mimosarum TaxID=312026 RepID=UPI0003FD2D16|nr:hypothetical protein [Paraburkholderia mimosarum]
MHPNDHAAQEIAHIRAMLQQLEQLYREHVPGHATLVTSPDYWRTRINSIRGISGLPAPLEKEVSALLNRVDALHKESGNDYPNGPQ